MTGTSLELIIRNETQVERLGSKTRVQTLAVLIPTAESRQPLIETLAAQAWYPKTTYPLDPNRPPHGRQFSGSVPRSDLAPLPVGTYQPTQLQQAITEDPSLKPLDGIPGSNMQSTQDEHSPRAPGDRVKTAMDPTPHPGEVRQHGEPLSARDTKATRTFAVLRMRQGDNPWELGSVRLNFESVMGTNVFDCLLPLRRSPYCRHENPESHFAVGPGVDELKRSVGFIDAKDMRKGRTGRRRELDAAASTYREEKPHRRRRRRRRSHKGESQDSSLPKESSGDPQIEMRDINHDEPPLRE
jgi:palmitoyltransferase